MGLQERGARVNVPYLSYAERMHYLDQVRRVISNEATAQEKRNFFGEVAQRLSPAKSAKDQEL